ncbi:MAG: hypothetical protein PF572_05040 [Patescibacteria group bacterium]|jgi:hypothetical protein|nr:hypothetical protein [Patescibacteria group bacterium]
MFNKLKIDNEYRIRFKNILFFKSFYFSPIVHEIRNVESSDFSKTTINRLKLFNINVDDIKSYQVFIFRKNNLINPSSFYVYNCQSSNNFSLRVLEILDISICNRHQNKKIGRQLISIIDNISKDNNIDYIVGELEKDSKYGSLEKRKRFFLNNDFKCWKNGSAKFSGWVIKKVIV